MFYQSSTRRGYLSEGKQGMITKVKQNTSLIHVSELV